MRVILADVKGAGGFVSKDTVAGGYGSRFAPFSTTTWWVHLFKRWYGGTPSVQMAYLAAIFARWGHDVVFTDGRAVDGDLALILSSLVDFRNETALADRLRARGTRVGFVGLAASKMPELFTAHADFIVQGEPEDAALRLAEGEVLTGTCNSAPTPDLDSLPFPRWDLIVKGSRSSGLQLSARPMGTMFPVLASRGCPEFCTYCPHRILAGYRVRSIHSVLDEIEEITRLVRHPYVIFRDPLFSEDRNRVVAFCQEVATRGLHFEFECETRLDRLDSELLGLMHRAGMRAMSFGVESVSPQALKRVGRRPIPAEHQRQILQRCRELGIVTAAFFILGLPTDDWASAIATIDFAVDLAPTFAQFKLLTPYPGTPLWKQLGPLVFEEDWEKFDGFTPTFNHPNLTAEQLKFLLGAAYTHFYMRPSYVANLLRLRQRTVREWVGRLDRRVSARIARYETEVMRPETI